MNYENKYNNALEKLQEALAPKDGREISGLTRACIEEIFPELKESEGEKIKELLKHYLEVRRCQTKDNEEYINCNHFIAWLEKQGKQKTDIPKWKYKKDNAPLSKDCLILNRYGCVVKSVSGAMVSDAWVLDYDELAKLPKEEVEKQEEEKPQGKSALEAANEEKVDNQNCVKPSDKVEPKFHEGEWIVWQDKCCKVNYNGCGYELVDQSGLSTSLEYGTVDENAHIWDIIKDAEDGNVLVSDNIIFIFNRIHDVWIKCHCSLYEDGSFYGEDFDLTHVHYCKEVFPATKEQCDKLLKAMTDAGYIFDFEKKELKKVEPKFKVKYAGSEYNVLETIKIPGGITYYGIEDEPNHIDYILPKNCEIISGYGVKEKGNSYPTKSTIFSQQNPAWSEEDDYNVQCLVAKVTSDIQNGNVGRNQELIDWLKSLKERCTWKPSNIQMECLHDAVEHYHKNGYPASKLNELYEQMSKIYKL